MKDEPERSANLLSRIAELFGWTIRLSRMKNQAGRRI